MIGGRGICLFLVGLGCDECVGVEILLQCLSGGCACSVLFLSLLERYFVTVAVCMIFMFACMSVVVMLSGSVGMFVVYLVLLNVVCFLVWVCGGALLVCVVDLMGIVPFV